MGGEKSFASLTMACSIGSSPHGRGKGLLCCPDRCFRRITPAWAGKRRRISCSPTRSRDHPRVGGEKDIAPVSPIGVSGSPPHGRGNADPKRHRTRQAGITPAWAGKRRSESCRTTVRRDHPRMGGEKRAEKVFKRSGAGSPPRWRGKVVGADSLLRETGITPAGRGKVLPCPALPDVPGITPALAGKRTTAAAICRSCRDHPRVGGEKLPVPELRQRLPFGPRNARHLSHGPLPCG